MVAFEDSIARLQSVGATHGNNAGRILLVSYDEPLLLTRRLLLEREGYEVIASLGFRASLEECRKGGFDLFVLGHSIPKADKQQLVNTFRERCPAPIISLLRPNEALVEGADYHINSEPTILLQLVGEIFGKQQYQNR